MLAQHLNDDPALYHQQRDHERPDDKFNALSYRQCAQPTYGARTSISPPKPDDKPCDSGQDHVADQRGPSSGRGVELAETVAVGSTSTGQVVANRGNEEH